MIQSNSYISQLGTPSQHLVGRERELAQLDAAWADPGCNLLCITGEDGVGKSSLINHWLNHPAQQQADIRMFGWSFYSQGSVANQTVAADFFIHEALAWFGDPDPAQGSGWDKGARLAELMAQKPALLILDGLELLQASQETKYIDIKDPAMRVLLHELAVENPGLALISSRCPVRNLSQFPEPQIRMLSLTNLTPEAGAVLLQAHGVTGSEFELTEASRTVDGHPLALTLLGSFVQDALAGDLRRLAEIPPPPADGKPGEQARRLMQAYGKWLGPSPEQSILHLLGLYLRPTDGDSLRRLLIPPAIPRLTDPLFTLKEQTALGFFRKKEEWPISKQAWHTAVANLRRANLLLPAGSTEPDEADYQLDAHPLVRKYFARQLGNNNPRAWYQGHERLYRYYQNLTEEYPESLSDMSLLYTAVIHGCRANDFEAALDQIYWTRIARKQEFYSTRALGVPGADLAALANAFRQPWEEPVKSLSKVMQATALNWTAALLQIQGRLEEARKALQAAMATFKAKKVWKQAALVAGNLSHLSLLLGDISTAMNYAQEGSNRAIRSRDRVQHKVARAAEANALHQAGRLAEAGQVFAEAEKMQQSMQPQYRFLHARYGFQYCDLLLSQGQVEAVLERASQTLALAREKELTIYMALDHLSLGRAYLVQHLTTNTGAAPDEHQEMDDDFQTAGHYLDQAVAGLRQEIPQEYLPAALLARAEWYRHQARWEQAQADITEAMALASRTGMKLFECDAHLAQAGLETAQGRPDQARLSLEQAKRLIEATGYHRRDGEVAILESTVINQQAVRA